MTFSKHDGNCPPDNSPPGKELPGGLTLCTHRTDEFAPSKGGALSQAIWHCPWRTFPESCQGGRGGTPAYLIT